MSTCKICNNFSPYIAKHPGVCLNCIRKKPSQAITVALQSHTASRLTYGLPPSPPKAEDAVQCKICANECRIAEGQYGYCGLRKNERGKLIALQRNHGKLNWYLDPLPTNCVADWVCPAGTGSGYPDFAYTNGPEYGYYNLAVFFHACSFNCLYCQNWHFKEETFKPETRTVDELLRDITSAVSCICYFGGDPSPQIIFAIEASRRAIKEKKTKILRICWETNGSMNKAYLEKMIELSLQSGGCIKFDLKAWDESLHIALTGVSNKRTLENFAYVAKFFEKRSVPPLLIGSTLLVPGYIDSEEVSNIAKFIASLNPEIPYRLLGFYPHFYMSDLPLTSKKLAHECYEAALSAGLKNVSIGNVHLLK
ncbi:radical SAM protein [Thermodesulfovibrio sp. 3907-1M]|uniref:Radical SAM protein n=1 Tax=Thermodesulfovibrio autotrophicus TaxID=3118333 RepID=A0AAU8GVX8_9BACT